MNDQSKTDTEKSETSNNENLPKVESETGLPAATTPVATPTAVPSTQNPTTPAPVVVAPQKKSSCLKIGLISCGVLALLLILCICVGFFTLPSLIKNATSTNNNFNKSEYTSYEDSNLNNQTIQDKIENGLDQNPDKSYTVSITEQDLINQIASNPDSKDIAKGIFIRMTPDLMSVKVELSTLLKSIPDEQKGGLDPELFKDVYIGADVSTSADGKQFEVKSVTTGNSYLDSLMAENFRSAFEEGLNEGLNQNVEGSGIKISKIKINENSVDITFAPISTEIE